jgi:hypothetical protein
MNIPTKLDIALAAHLCPLDDDREMAGKWRAEAAQLIADHVASSTDALMAQAEHERDCADAAENRCLIMRVALERLRDCDFIISLPDRMDSVREIARHALDEEDSKS